MRCRADQKGARSLCLGAGEGWAQEVIGSLGFDDEWW